MANLLSSLLICLFLGSVLVMGFADPDKSTNNPRTSRAGLQLQGSRLSTARGFGKRARGFLGAPILPQVYFPPRYSVSQYKPFAGETQLGNKMTSQNSWLWDGNSDLPVGNDRYIEENSDGTSDELKRRFASY